MIHLLFVDSEAHLLELGKKILGESNEVRVKTASSVQEALKMFEGSRFDGVISDHQTPEIDGIAFLKRLRSEGSDVPFILFTGQCREEVIIEALNSGANYYVQKGGDPAAKFTEIEHKMREAVRRNRAERACHENEERLRRAQAIGPMGCWEFYLDSEGGHFWGSEETFHLFGIPWRTDGVLPLEQLEACIQERGRVHRALQDLIEKGTHYNLEYEIAPADGGPHKFIRSRAELVSDLNGRPPKVVGIILDNTERKRTEEDLKAREETYRDLILNAPTAIYELDYRGPRLKSVNEAMCRISGYSREELLSSNPLELLDQASRVRFQERIRKGLAGEKIDENVEYKGMTKEGRDIWFTLSINNIYRGGKLDRAFVVAHDITDRKRDEEVLRRVNSKLNLLSSITRHDLINQMTVLIGNLVLLKEKNSYLSSDVYMQRSLTSAERISVMVQFTKEYEDIGVHAPIWQNLGALVETAAKEVNLNRVQVVNDIAAGIEIYADPLIQKVFYNLVDNAVRYGDTITTVRFSIEKHNGKDMLICADNGLGVPADMKENLFTRGFGKNHGFGLFLSREILAITGITIREEGEPGQGARFVMTLPPGGLRQPDGF